MAYYYGEKVPNFASGAKYVRETLGIGFDYDDLNKEVLLTSSVTEDGQLVLPSGMRYQLLVLPDNEDMSLEVLYKIETLLKEGASILGNRPLTVPGLKDYKKREKELRSLADDIWPKSNKKLKRNYGKGTIYVGYTEREILASKGILADFQYDFPDNAVVHLDYIHRATTSDDIYFIRNIDSAYVQAMLDFRIKDKQPYLYDPVQGTVNKVALYIANTDRTRLPIRLSPYGSVCIVFSDHPGIERHIIAVEKDGQIVFPQNLHYDFRISSDNKDEMVFIPSAPGNYTLTFNDGTTKELVTQRGREDIELKNTWEVHFPYGWGFEPVQQFDSLCDWRNHYDKALSIFSGTATYETSFSINDSIAYDTGSWSLDLGVVGDVAKVYLNGQEVGISVFPPYIFNVDGLLRAGDNVLMIDVANTWLNQLIGEKDTPFDQQRTRSNVGWGSRENPGRYWNDYKPLPSGLMGPVRLIQNENIIF